MLVELVAAMVAVVLVEVVEDNLFFFEIAHLQLGEGWLKPLSWLQIKMLLLCPVRSI